MRSGLRVGRQHEVSTIAGGEERLPVAAVVDQRIGLTDFAGVIEVRVVAAERDLGGAAVASDERDTRGERSVCQVAVDGRRRSEPVHGEQRLR